MTSRPAPITYIPVEKDGDIFVVSSDWIRSDLPFPSEAEVAAVLGTTASCESAKVRYGGSTRTAIVYGSDDEKLKYALLSEAPSLAEGLMPEAELYATALQRLCTWTEYVLPEQRADLDQDFIEPNLIGESGQKHHWSELRTANRVMICGTAGAGKTTLVRRWLKDEAGRFASSIKGPLPIYIALRHWRGDASLALQCERELTSLGGASLAANFDRLASEGRVMLVLDGLDEIPLERRQSAFDAIGVFLNSYFLCGMVITARWGVSAPILSNFRTMELAPLENRQIKEFAYHKLYDHRRWQQFSNRLQSELELQEIVGNPLLLTLLLARFARNEIMPSYISDALSAIVRVLFDEWDSVRGIVRWNEAPPSANRKEAILRILATYVSETNRSAFDAAEVEGHLRRASIEMSTTTLLGFLEESTSLIRHRDDNKWEFRYGLIQEFLSASHWLDRMTSRVDEVVRALARKPADVLIRRFRFLSGLSSDATEPIQRTLDQSGELSIETAIALSEAMTQRLIIEPETVAKYGKFMCSVIEGTFVHCTIALTSPTDSTRTWELTAKKHDGAPSTEWIENFLALFRVLHRMREGSGRAAIEEAFAISTYEAVRVLVVFLGAEGQWQDSVDQDDGTILMRISLAL